MSRRSCNTSDDRTNPGRMTDDGDDGHSAAIECYARCTGTSPDGAPRRRCGCRFRWRIPSVSSRAACGRSRDSRALLSALSRPTAAAWGWVSSCSRNSGTAIRSPALIPVELHLHLFDRDFVGLQAGEERRQVGEPRLPALSASVPSSSSPGPSPERQRPGQDRAGKESAEEHGHPAGCLAGAKRARPVNSFTTLRVKMECGSRELDGAHAG